MTCTAQSFLVIKPPKDGTLVQKHVGVGTYHEMCFIVLYLVHFIGQILNVRKCMV